MASLAKRVSKSLSVELCVPPSFDNRVSSFFSSVAKPATEGRFATVFVRFAAGLGVLFATLFVGFAVGFGVLFATLFVDFAAGLGVLVATLFVRFATGLGVLDVVAFSTYARLPSKIFESLLDF